MEYMICWITLDFWEQQWIRGEPGRGDQTAN